MCYITALEVCCPPMHGHAKKKSKGHGKIWPYAAFRYSNRHAAMLTQVQSFCMLHWHHTSATTVTTFTKDVQSAIAAGHFLL